MSIDLNELKQQIEEAIPWRDGVLTVAQAHALLDEVEWLRGECGKAYLRGVTAGRDAERIAERAAVVAWLRERAARRGFTVICPDELAWCADTIERGEHRRKEKP